MECLQARIDSFSKAKRVKKVSLKWPHPTSASSSNAFKATPATLAEAGFFYDPAVDDLDNVTCFMCDKELSGWEEDDDPFQIHYDKCKTKCCWALLRCGLRDDIDRHGRFVFPDKSRLPTTKAMEKARLETFLAGDGWVHDQTRGHGANSKKLAKAGFVCTPQHPGDDLATCLYCNLSLSGWDKDDDPLEEHRKRKDKSGYPCPFFPSSSGSNPPSSSPPFDGSTSTLTKGPTRTKPPSRSAKPPSRVQPTPHEDVFMPTKIHDGDLNSDGREGDESESGKSTKSTRSSSRKSTASGSTAKTPRKASSKTGPASTRKPSGAKTPASKSVSRSSSRSALKNVVEDEQSEEEPDIVEVETKPKGKKASTAKTPAKSKAKKSTTVRGRSRSVAPDPSGSDAELVTEEEEIEPPATVKKKPASKSKAPSQTPAPAKKPRGRSNSVARSVVPDHPSEAEIEPEEVEPPKTIKKVKSKVSKKTPAPAPVQNESNDEAGSDMDLDDAWTTAPETERKASKGARSIRKSTKNGPEPKKSKVVEQQTGDEEEDIERTVKKPASKSKSSTIAKAKPSSKAKPKAPKQVVESEVDTDADPSEVEPAPVKKPSRATSSKPSSKPQTMDKGKGKAVAAKSSTNQKARWGTQSESEAGTDQERGREDEDEFGPIIRQPSFDVNGKGNGKTSNATAAIRPPKKASPVMMNNQDGDEDVEMTPLFVPKRTAPPPAPPIAREPSIGRVKQAVLKPVKPKKQIKVVDISSDEDEEDEKLVEEQVQVVPTPHKPTITQSVKLVKKKPIEDTNDDDVMNLDAIEPQTDIDISMHEHNTEDDRGSHQAELELPATPPRAPARNLSSFPVPQASSSSQPAPATSQDATRHDQEDEPEAPPFFPPLSKLPFMPLPSLAPAEMDMSVEEWVRYQMEMEYDKFKRDGERELVRFRQKAEDVRKIIDGL